ncbi:MAG: hypothetical protein CUR34_07650 [Sediminibacterium sp.]|nr:MAG: hypothetical protein CUR34_07650 [Sediminibacterium sp.] [Sediminibacterium sp. FEMGT703S]
MKIYHLETLIKFGVYNGKTLQQVMSIDKPYIEFCLNKLEHFVITEETIRMYQMINPTFILSIKAENALREKIKKLKDLFEQEDDNDWDEEDGNEHPKDSYGSSGTKYGWYNGFSDDVIDDAFEGDPSNTWNVD